MNVAPQSDHLRVVLSARSCCLLCIIFLDLDCAAATPRNINDTPALCPWYSTTIMDTSSYREKVDHEMQPLLSSEEELSFHHAREQQRARCTNRRKRVRRFLHFIFATVVLYYGLRVLLRDVFHISPWHFKHGHHGHREQRPHYEPGAVRYNFFASISYTSLTSRPLFRYTIFWTQQQLPGATATATGIYLTISKLKTAQSGLNLKNRNWNLRSLISTPAAIITTATTSLLKHPSNSLSRQINSFSSPEGYLSDALTLYNLTVKETK